MKALLIELPLKKEYSIFEDNISIGRNKNNQIVINNSTISKEHCIIFINSNLYYIKDCGSKNGTFVNGERVDNERELYSNDIISLGKTGAIFQFKYRPDDTDDLVNTKIFGDGTTKHLVNKTIKRKITINNKIIFSFIVGFAFILISLAIGLNVFINASKTSENYESFLYFENQYRLNLSLKDDMSYDIKEVNGKLLSVKQIFINLMDKYGEENYDIDDATINKLKYYINYYKGSATFKEGLERRNLYLNTIEEVFAKHNIPIDLSYIAFVESFYKPEAYNRNSGAKGMWQFMSSTGRGYGLVINNKIDEREDVVKSTEAAAEYINDLLAIFGIRSITIAMAAYNAGDEFLRWTLKKINDPIKDRSFWYLYRNKLIPKETREYVFKILALIILTENPEIE